MAYTVLIAKERVRQQGSNFNIVLNVKITEAAGEVLNFNVSVVYNPNTSDMEGIMAALRNKLKARWDRYKSSKLIYDSGKLNNVVNVLQTQAQTYVNL